jgi:hypothetical protein
LSSVLPDLESLDLRAKMSVKQKAISMDDSAMAVEEKKNPTAHQLLMKIPKKNRPGIKLAEVGIPGYLSKAMER